MLKVGITGGIGSGKTTVCQIFFQLGIPIFNADQAVKELYAQHQGLKLQLKSAFGTEVYISEDQINIPFLKGLFASPENTEKLNKIVHPLVFQAFYDWAEKQDAPYVIKEAAILFESGANKTVDKVIGVIAPEELRIERVRTRDQRSLDEIKSIIDKQLSNNELREKCDYIIENDGNQSLIQQVRELHSQLLHQSAHFGS
jgi:dephospho-CoA kinase